MSQEAFIQALGGRVRLAVTDASHIHVDANHNCLTGGPTACGPLTIRGVAYGVSIHYYRQPDGSFDIGQTGDDTYKQRDSLYMSRLNAKNYAASYPSESARRKVAETITPLVNAWATQNPEVFASAERERREREREQAAQAVRKAEQVLLEAQDKLRAL